MRRNWLVLLIVCLAVVMMAVLPGCRSKTKKPAEETPKVDGILIEKAGMKTINFTDLAWQKVATPDLNAMKDLAAIETDAAATTPDLSKVSGGGIYFVDVGDATQNLCIGSIKWTGADDDNVTDGFGEFPEDEDSRPIIQNGVINTVYSPDSGYAWTAYCPDYADEGATLAQIDKYYDGRIKLYGSTDSYKGENADPESTFVEKGAYVYSIFAKAPAEGEELSIDIDKELDMTEGSVSIEFLSDDSGAYPVVIKLLVRDAKGDWYLGGGGAPEEVAEINETFDWTDWVALVGWNQTSAVRKSDATGFPWSAYSPTDGEFNPITSDGYWEGRIKFEKDDAGNTPGNYVFTIFDITGGNEANRWVNMSAGTLVVTLDKEGEDGAFPLGIKILARDGEGNWFLSNAVEVKTGSNSIAFVDLTWERVASNVAGWMNAMAGGDCADYAMDTEEGEANPDLTKVTGGGIYIDSITDETKASIVLAALKWTAGADE